MDFCPIIFSRVLITLTIMICLLPLSQEFVLWKKVSEQKDHLSSDSKLDRFENDRLFPSFSHFDEPYHHYRHPVMKKRGTSPESEAKWHFPPSLSSTKILKRKSFLTKNQNKKKQSKRSSDTELCLISIHSDSSTASSGKRTCETSSKARGSKRPWHYFDDTTKKSISTENNETQSLDRKKFTQKRLSNLRLMKFRNGFRELKGNCKLIFLDAKENKDQHQRTNDFSTTLNERKSKRETNAVHASGGVFWHHDVEKE